MPHLTIHLPKMFTFLMQNLDDYLASQPELPTETILHIIDQLGAALDDLHNSRGMVHNDLKPAQVCLSRKVLSEPAGSGKPGAPGPASAPLPGVYLVDYGISCAPGTPVIDHGFGGTLIYMVGTLTYLGVRRNCCDEHGCVQVQLQLSSLQLPACAVGC